ncbi:oligosaccharide repeat unit polymerase [Clostridium botulinum]|nr:oligosaccharide repeat unit polymerase [Clostridium botulinum]NFP01072.1 oligosaccharide repeat unit polymerase [Clostridium botulinum]
MNTQANIFNKKNRSFIFSIILSLLLIYTFLLISIVETQMITMKNTVIRDAEIKIVIILAVLIYFISRRYIKLHKVDKISILYLIMILYLVFDILCMSIYNSTNFKVAINLIGRNYFAVLIGAFFYLVKENVNIEKIFKITILFTIINLVISYVQHYSNSILFPYLYDSYGNNIFNSIEFGENNFRSVGITSSGYNLGIVLIFLLTIDLAVILSHEKKFVGFSKKFFIILFPFILISILYTQTRNIYFFSAYIICFLFIYYKIRILRKILIKYSIIISPILYYIILSKISELQNFLYDKSIYSLNSFQVRVGIFKDNIDLIRNSSILNILFGNKEIAIDNIFLYCINTIGIVGMILMITLTLAIYVKLVNIKKIDLISLILASYYSATFLLGLLNMLTFEFYFLSMILSSIWIRKREKILINQQV